MRGLECVHIFVFLWKRVRETDEGQWQMSREEPCVHGAVSDRSLCLALRVTSGTQWPLGSAGVGNYPVPHPHTQWQARDADAALSTSFNVDRMGTWHKVGSTNTGVGGGGFQVHSHSKHPRNMNTNVSAWYCQGTSCGIIIDLCVQSIIYAGWAQEQVFV